MCDDIVKEDIIKCQVCLGWPHGACPVWTMGWTFFKKVVLNFKSLLLLSIIITLMMSIGHLFLQKTFSNVL